MEDKGLDRLLKYMHELDKINTENAEIRKIREREKERYGNSFGRNYDNRYRSNYIRSNDNGNMKVRARDSRNVAGVNQRPQNERYNRNICAIERHPRGRDERGNNTSVRNNNDTRIMTIQQRVSNENNEMVESSFNQNTVHLN